MNFCKKIDDKHICAAPSARAQKLCEHHKMETWEVFCHMLPEIFIMAMNDFKAREQISEIRRLAKEQGISAKYITLPEAANR